MGGEIFNKQRITKYLLGSLTGAEAERFDELSLTDDEFAAALSVAENDLVDAYVQGELTGDAADQFKSHYLASPLRRNKVEFAQAFQHWSEKKAIAHSRELGEQDRPQKRKNRGGFSAWSIFGAPRPAIQWGFAATALALIVVVGLLGVQNIRQREQLTNTRLQHAELVQREKELQKEIETQRSASAETAQELARARTERERLELELKSAQVQGTSLSLPGEGRIVSLILAPPLRGAGQPPSVSIKPGTRFVAAQLILENNDHSAYRVALIDPANNETVWRSANLRPRTKGDSRVIGVSFPATLLTRHNYILRVAGSLRAGGTDIVGDYPFKVVK